MIKKIVLLACVVTLIGCSGAPWKTRDKILFGGFTALNVVDMCQTTYIYNHPEEFKEANPLMSKDSYIPIMIGFNVLAYVIIEYLPSDYRTWFLLPLIGLKAITVVHNNSIGVEF